MIHYKLHKPKEAIHCVCADVSSTYWHDWTIYYTHHMYTDTPQDVYADANYSCDWKIWCTHHIYKDALHCAYADVSSNHNADWIIWNTPHT
jgi:hypothetical protein